mgnify:CR=1 FL=1
MNIFLQAAANGIMVGGIYALIGMSLTLIFGVMKIINFCQGELLMLGMYISFVLFDQCGLDPFVAIPIVAVVMFAFGALLQSTLITRSLHGNDDTNVLFLTVGLGILFQNVALLYFKSDYRTAQSMFSEKKNGSKTALIGLSGVLRDNNFYFIDCQFYTEHLERMGGRYVEWEEYVRMLKEGTK